VAAPEAPPTRAEGPSETPSRRRGILDRVTGRITWIVLGVLAVGVLVAFISGSGGSQAADAPRAHSLPPAERVGVPVPLAASTITGIDAPSIGLSTDDTTSLDLRDDNSLDVPRSASTVGWYQRSASPGEVGAAVLAAHVNYRGEQGAFVHIGRMAAGDTVEVHRDDGTTAVFAVDRVDQVVKDAFPTEAVYGPTPDSQLRLITCGGVFDERKRSYEDNIVVYAHLVSAYRAP
jgi:hypothetical protein